MPADLTNPTPDDNAYGLECPEHPAAARYGLALAHAQNAVAKHNRDHHAEAPEPQVNVTAAALAAWDAMAPVPPDASPLAQAQALAITAAAREFLEALTGLTGQEAIDQAAMWAYANPPIVAHVAPF